MSEERPPKNGESPNPASAQKIWEKQPREIQELGDFLREFNEESDRGAALVAASVLDERLKGILETFLLESKISTELLSSFNAPVGTFSSRTALAYALGLIQKNEFDEITLIRKIRNVFGHKWKGVTFEAAPVRDLCNKLPWLGPSGEVEEENHPRTRFNFAIAILLTDLMWRERLVSKERRTSRVWPNKSRGQ